MLHTSLFFVFLSIFVAQTVQMTSLETKKADMPVKFQKSELSTPASLISKETKQSIKFATENLIERKIESIKS